AGVEGAERPIEAHAGGEIAVAEHRVADDLIFEKHGIQVEASTNRASGSRLDETGLAQLGAGASLRKIAIPRLEPAQAGGVENHARSHVDRETTEAAQKVSIFPPCKNVPVCLDRRELDTASEPDRAKLGRYHVDAHRHDR